MGFFESMIPPEWAAQVVRAGSAEFWFGTAVVVAFAAAAAFGFHRFLHRLRIIEDTPTSRIRSAAQGYVELVGWGKLMDGPPIVAPLTGTVCTWYRYKIEERTESYDSRGSRRTRWRTINSGTSDSLFLLMDDTGACVIDPDGAEVTPGAADTWHGNSPSWTGGPPDRKRARLFSAGRYRYTEERMHQGDPLYAIGMFRTEGGPYELPNVREEARHVLNRWKQDQAALLQRFDRNGDGQIDLQEWEEARKAAHQEVMETQAERMRDPSVNLMSRPQDGRPYILSVLAQEHLAHRLRMFSLAAFGVFMFAGALATWLLTVRFSH